MQTDKRRIVKHIMFWSVATLVATLVYGYSLPNFYIALTYILMLMPADMIYFYTVSYWVIPTFFYRKKYLKMFVAFAACAIVVAVIFRLLQIFLAEPYLYKIKLAADPNFKWPRIQGTFWERFSNPEYLLVALEGTNVVIWIGLFVKFVMMWVDKRQAAAQAELNFLKSQIHPHFLFNTLNNLYALTLKQSPQSPVVVMGLSQILRYMLYECNNDSVLLKRDIEILQSYVELEKIRYEERLELNFSIRGRVKDQQVPPLMMLPLVENAFKHGTSETMYDAWINIDLQIDHRRLIFKVSNSKPENVLEDADQHFGKIGLSNVRKRLEFLHNDNNQLHIYEEDDMYITILELDLY
ncbi:sensor histidine kinase [Mucilaginibacter litoreus]|uniref:Sensor histidine kinase n=1 Tax=Mucilaginibacter litoreus TaxID=1048221 RepID=A0ABW3AP16_9SPHI